MAKQGVISVEQTVHGYRDGHELLASSIDLPPEDRAVLLIHSDLSSTAPPDRVFSYLTAYPLLQSKYYAIGKTWYADEMPRPGCVWTHTLLIKYEDVARIAGIEDILHVFKRPSESILSDFSHSVETVAGNGLVKEIQKEISYLLVEALYSKLNVNLPVIVSGDKSNEVENVIFAIWRQQWPKLRRSFRFSTGAHSAAGESFDIAIAYGAERDHSDSQSVQVELDFEKEETKNNWVVFAVADLIQNKFSGLRNFLWQFGPDFSNGRAAYYPLCEVARFFDKDSNIQSAQSLVEMLTELFPGETGARLKSHLLGPKEDSGFEAELLLAISNHSSMSSTLKVRERAARLFAKNPYLVLEKVLALEDSNIERERDSDFLLGISESALDLLDAVVEDLPISKLAMLVRLQPKILEKPCFWKRKPSEIKELASEFLPYLSDNGDRLLEAILLAKAFAFLPMVFDLIKKVQIEKVLYWLDSQNEDNLSIVPELIELLESRNYQISDLLCRLKLVRAGAILLTATAFRLGIEIEDGMLSPTLGHIDNNIRVIPERLRIDSDCFLLSEALSAKGAEGAVLPTRAFSHIYSKLKKNELPQYCWNRLDSKIPWDLFGWWDRPARLVRGIAQKFAENQWPGQYFVQTFNTEKLIELAVAELSKTVAGAFYINRLLEDEKVLNQLTKRQIQEIRKKAHQET